MRTHAGGYIRRPRLHTDAHTLAWPEPMAAWQPQAAHGPVSRGARGSHARASRSLQLRGKANAGEADRTPEDIRAMVKQLIAPKNRKILFVQQCAAGRQHGVREQRAL